MAHLCIFGSREGRFNPRETVYISIFAGAKLKRSTAAVEIANLPRDPSKSPRSPICFFLTVFSGVELTSPTLAEEFLALFDALRAGTLTLDDWDRYVAHVGDGDRFHAHSLTLFGGLDTESVPGEDKELDDLSLQRHLAHIPEAAVQILMLAVGQQGPARLAAIREAAATAMAGP